MPVDRGPRVGQIAIDSAPDSCTADLFRSRNPENAVEDAAAKREVQEMTAGERVQVVADARTWRWSSGREFATARTSGRGGWRRTHASRRRVPWTVRRRF